MNPMCLFGFLKGPLGQMEIILNLCYIWELRTQWNAVSMWKFLDSQRLLKADADSSVHMIFRTMEAPKACPGIAMQDIKV